MYPMELRPVSLVLIDISGYTRFTRLHRLSALHAERIIGDLLESIIGRAKAPLTAHEILGDAVSFYVEAEGNASLASGIRRQVASIFDAFRLREGELISDCSLCVCEACRNVGKLQLKAVLHYGQAVFGQVGGMRKISGADVILAHRLLKNSVPTKEYVLETEPFYRLGGGFPDMAQEARNEPCAEFGTLRVRVFYPKDLAKSVRPANRSFSDKIRRSLRNDWYALRRLFSKRAEVPVQQPQAPASETARFIADTHFPVTRHKPDP
jgi:hypothetical protein